MKDTIIDFLRHQLGEKPAIIGLSGGVDSAVVAMLLTQAISHTRIYAYALPSIYTNPRDIDDAKHLAEMLKIHFEIISIDSIFAAFQHEVSEFNEGISKMNLQPRIRMTILYGKANALNGLVVGTGNKTELMVGYFTKYGDGGVDILPIGNLYKTQVWELAKELGIPQHIIAKSPSAGLTENQTDEGELGITYNELDKMLQSGNLSQNIEERVQKAKHKLHLPPMP